MKAEIEPMQQPVRKVVGRYPVNSNPLRRLKQLEQLIAFIKKFAPEALLKREGDYYPVRKVVGRPDKILAQAQRQISK